jgi:hypothetical protein
VNRGLAAAAAIVVSFAFGTVIASREAAAADRQPTYSCSAVDRDFLETAVAQMTAFRAWGADYVTGQGEGTEQAALAAEAQQMILGKHPTDRALEQSRLLMGAMLIEYQRAVTAPSALDAGTSFRRVHDLGVSLRSLLAESGPSLAHEGCDVAPLL